MELVRERQLVAAAVAVRCGGPFADAVQRENGSLLEWRREECTCRMRDVMQQYNIPPNVPFEQIVSSGSTPAYQGDVRILNASYGNGFRVANVTQRLQDMVHGGQFSVYVDNDSMGTDPAPGMRKSLTVTYSYRGGRTQTVTVKEGQSLTIP